MQARTDNKGGQKLVIDKDGRHPLENQIIDELRERTTKGRDWSGESHCLSAPFSFIVPR